MRVKKRYPIGFLILLVLLGTLNTDSVLTEKVKDHFQQLEEAYNNSLEE